MLYVGVGSGIGDFHFGYGDPMNVNSDSKSPIKLWLDDLEPEALQQVKNVANLPFIFKHVAVMPDAHFGKGATIGSVIATKGAIIPAAVGVDLGCGMCAVKLPFKVDVLGGDAKLKLLRYSIQRSVPVGRDGNSNVSDRVADKYHDLLGKPHSFTNTDFGNAIHQLGSLGGGNHFIEICRDKNDTAWVVLHSGSRHIGKALADLHISKAKGLMKQYFIELPDPDLAYFVQDTPEFNLYIKDMLWCQDYARENRNEMMSRILKDISRHVYGEEKMRHELEVTRIDCHHNFTQMENHFDRNVWVTRKGAVSAKVGEFGIIPGSMGVKSFIVRGLGNPDSFHSCSHGTGRRMSRTKARATFKEADLCAQTEGVECRKDKDVIDEIPGAYKDIDVVMTNQADLVEPVFELKQIICIKG